eukprot:1235820-Ditylum_brightwellii.AAC.1
MTVILLTIRVALVDVSFNDVDNCCKFVGVFKQKDVTLASACGTGALVLDTAAALLQRSVCLVGIGDCEYEDSTCSRYSADSMPVSSVQ